MKLVLIVASYIVLLVCLGDAVPSVPKDNSHYVEGVSRYVWMSDEDGTPHLVDLQEPIDTATLMNRNETGNQYWLFTRSNRYTPQLIVHGNYNSIQNSNFVASKPLKVIVHGWHGSLTSNMNIEITAALLGVEDVNVIVVDWSTVAASNYLVAAFNTPRVGQAIGDFVIWLINSTRGNWNNVHLIGFSLGAHAVGNAGRVANGRPRRITGLDPAGPGWHTNPNNIRYSDGVYVETMHTDIAVMGILIPTGHVGFYPNGGRRQPGCDTNQCSHSRAWELFTSSVITNHFIGRQCVDLDEAVSSECTGSIARMGNSILNKQGIGIYGLRTHSLWPF